jgi:hypothetical protein
MPRRVLGRSRPLTFIAMVVVSASLAALASAVGCAFQRSGLRAQTCSSDAECDDGNPCSDDFCNPDGLCDGVANDGNSAGLVQVPGDCQHLACVAGLPVGEPAPDDVPANPCLDARCDGGQLTSDNRPEGTPCTEGAGSGTCDGAGICIIACTPQNAATVCDDGEPCTLDSCNLALAACERQGLDNQPAPDAEQVAGDCSAILCIAGASASVADDNDLPVDGIECTDDVCAAGVPGNPPSAAETACGASLALFCDGFGACVGCVNDGNCGVTTDCAIFDCLPDNSCTVTHPSSGTLTTDQSGLAQCRVRVCNGTGGIVVVNAAPNATCTDNSMCTGDDRCNTSGVCVPGADPCATTPNCNQGCNPANGMCNVQKGVGAYCTDNLYCNGSDTCNAGGSCVPSGVNPCGSPTGGNCLSSCDEDDNDCNDPDPANTCCNFGGSAGECNSSGGCIAEVGGNCT